MEANLLQFMWALLYSLVLYLFVFAYYNFLPAMVLFCLRRFARIKRRILGYAGAFLVCAEVVTMLALAANPVYICPEEYAAYIDKEEEWKIQFRGLYSYRVPIFVIRNEVISADTEVIRVKTVYFPFGDVITEWNDDGWTEVKPLSGL